MTVRLSLRGESQESWLLKVDDATTVAEVAESLRVDADTLTSASAESSLADAGVHSGSVLPLVAGDTAPGTLRLEFIGGPFAGETIGLPLDRPVTIGRGDGVDVQVDDPFLLPHHLSLTVSLGEEGKGGRRPLIAALSPESGADLSVSGVACESPVSATPADTILIGSNALRVGLAPRSDADVTPESLGMRGFNRPSRISPSESKPSVQLPNDKPEDQDKSPIPWLSAILPVVLGITMATLFGRVIMLLMAAASPIMVIGSYITNKKLMKRKGERTEEQWIAEVQASRERIEELVREQRVNAWYRHPDPTTICDIATRPTSRLWERRRTDADALWLRVGVTEVDLDVQFEGGSQKDNPEARRVGVTPSPVSADLSEGPVGIAGPDETISGLARSMVSALGTLRSPRDLQLLVICDDASEADWSWTSWMPHTQLGDDLIALMGNTDDTRREHLRSALKLLEQRARAGTKAQWDTELVILVDGARRFRTLPGMVPLLQNGTDYGIHVIALDSDRSRLPEECRSVIVADGADPTLARFESEDVFYPTVLLDSLSTSNAERIARSLCSVLHVSGVGDEGMLPTSVRYAELLNVDLEDPSPIVSRWEISPRQTYVVVGAGADSEFALDIVSDGPHALVAGTTGSGKSEFLQALVVSLAMANRPDALNFVLVDYKGGSAFADCERLTHTVGMVTNLDARETERALASLDAELKRRERVLRDLEAKDIDAAWAKDPDASAARGLARLMIVIDEFAELKTELPEFINGLVRIARVGRSLGVNLVLATQRPSGVITPEMQSNINLRVALRVTDRADSNDVLGSGEAALISPSTPGRGLVRAGSASAPVAFQTARVAGIRPGVHRTARVLPPKAKIEWKTLGLPPRFPASQQQSVSADPDDTDLRALVNVINAAATESGVARNPSPWLLPLPAVLPLERLTEEPIDDDELFLGLEDVPGEQAQRPLTWNVVTGSHLLFMGGSMSGRTSALRTVLAQVTQKFSPTDVHMYIADYGNGGLLPLADAPHCGAVVTQLDPDRLPRLMSRLLEDLSIRQNRLSRAGVGHITEQRRLAADGEELPYMLVVVDGWERLSSTLDPDKLIIFRDQFMRVLREGPAVGIRVIITGDRSIPSDKVAGFIDTQYIFPLRDVNDYRAAGILIREVPTGLPAGRVLFGADGAEAQFAVLDRDTSGEGQTTALRAIIEKVRDDVEESGQTASGPKPFRVDPLPGYYALSAAYELPLAPGRSSAFPVVGIGGDELSRFTIDWPHEGGFTVVGRRGTGRSNALSVIAHQLVWQKRRVLAVAPARSMLTDVAAASRIPLLSDPETELERLQEVVESIPGDGPLTVVIDDAERLKQKPLEMALSMIGRSAVFCVGIDAEAVTSQFSGPYVEAKKAHSGILLSPEVSIIGTQTFGTQVPKFLLGKTGPGGGILYRDGSWIPTRVPDVKQ